MNQEGELSKIRYQIEFTPEYERLFQEARVHSGELSWINMAERGREFPQVVVRLDPIDLNNASSADIGALTEYFAYQGKDIEEIVSNILYKRA